MIFYSGKDSQIAEIVNKRNNEIKQLLPILIESYVEYYGEQHRQHITSVINSITFIHKQNQSTKLLGSSNDDYIKKDYSKMETQLNNINEDEGSTLQKIYPLVVVLSYHDSINIHTLIHEINHCLHNFRKEINNDGISSLMTMFSNIYEYKEGIPLDYSGDNLFYEIINEYMTEEILSIFLKNGKNLDIPMETNFDYNRYLYLDGCCDDDIKKLYETMKDDIKNNLITANGEKLKNIIGWNEYEFIHKNLIQLHKMFFEEIKLICNGNNNDQKEDIYQQVIDKLYDSSESLNISSTINKIIADYSQKKGNTY